MTDHPVTVTDDEALMGPWQELQEALRSFFLRRVKADDVDDLMQECFLRVSQGLPALRDRERIGTWMFRIARNLVVDHRLRLRRSLPPDVRGGEAAGEGPAEEEDLDLRIGGWLASMIDQLPARYSEVLRDSELTGIPHRDIADRLGLSISGVKSRVQRGRAMLRDRLLACCALEFDSRGRVRDYERKAPNSCDC